MPVRLQECSVHAQSPEKRAPKHASVKAARVAASPGACPGYSCTHLGLVQEDFTMVQLHWDRGIVSRDSFIQP